MFVCIKYFCRSYRKKSFFAILMILLRSFFVSFHVFFIALFTSAHGFLCIKVALKYYFLPS